MRNRLFVVLTTVALATSSLPIGVCADADVDPMATESVDIAPTADEDVILSGDCSATAEDHVEWKVVKNNETAKLKLIISGTGKSNVQLVNIERELRELREDEGDSIREVEVCEGVTAIGDWAFANGNRLEKVKLPNGLSSIGKYSFYRCFELKEIKIPNSVTDIGNNAFCACESLTEITIPEGVKDIDATIIEFCSNLKTLRLPHTVKRIGGYPVLLGEDDDWDGCRPHSNFWYLPLDMGTALTDIYYNGTKEEWDAIEKPEQDDFIDESKITIHCLDSEIPTVTATPVPTATATPAPTATAAPTAAVSEISGQISGTALSLKGKLGVNVLLGFADAKTVEEADPCVVVTVNGKETVLKLSEQEHYTSGKNEIYEITTFVPAKQINEKIELRVVDKRGNVVEIRNGKKTLTSYVFSIKDLADSYLKNTKQSDAKTTDLVKAIKNYGGYVQLLTGYKAHEAKITDKLTKITAKDLKPYKVVADKGSKIAKYTGIGLSLQSDTNMQVYFKLTDKADAYTFTVDGENVTPEDCGENLYCVNLNSIPAGKLSSESEIVISKGDESFTIKASALSWAESVLSKPNVQKQKTIDMAKMLYRYAQKADAYFSKA